MKQLCYVHDEFQGQSTLLPEISIHGDSLCSRAFFCEDCGEVWARFIVDNAKWSVIHRSCYKCGDGSLFISWWPEHNRALPRALLEREVEFHFEINGRDNLWKPQHAAHNPLPF